MNQYFKSWRIMITKIVPPILCTFLLVCCACGVSAKTSGVLSREVATTTKVYVECDPPYGSNDYYHSNPTFTIDAVLKPGSLAQANAVYLLELYENGNFRSNSDTEISWTQNELNVSQERTVKFSCTEQEYLAYFGKDISSVFMIVPILSTDIPISST